MRRVRWRPPHEQNQANILDGSPASDATRRTCQLGLSNCDHRRSRVPDLLPLDPLSQDLVSALEAPSAAHWFGTDE